LVVYDRWVNDAGLDTNLPGHNGNVTTTRNWNNTSESGSYQIVDESTSNLLKYGPGGIMVDDTSTFNTDSNGDHSGNNHLGTFNIGGGGATNHGYMSNLDSDVLGLATRNTTTQYVDAVWSYGSGAVYYSTTPTDAYIGSNFAENDAWDAYALNSLHYATSLIFDGYSQIDGTSSADQLYGTTGDDVFWSKDGADEIWSGNGSDTFLYTQTYQTDPGSNDVILDFDYQNDKIDISAITNGAGISRTLTDGTLFKIDSDNNGTYEMQWDLDDYTGTADQVTVVT
jgi:Ca2+-binding RTX toxin-like protein